MAIALPGLFCYSNCISLCPHITLSSYYSEVNVVECLMSMPAVREFSGSNATFPLAQLVEMQSWTVVSN